MMRKLMLAASLLAFVACSQKEDAGDEASAVTVDVTVVMVNPNTVKIIATVTSEEEITDPFFKVSIADDYTVSGPTVRNFSTNELVDGEMSILIRELSPDELYTFRTRFIHHGVNYDSSPERFTMPDLPAGLIDMGLSVKWASTNLGATKLDDAGNKYAWGETQPKDSFSRENYKWSGESEDGFSKYNAKDGLTTLLAEDDAATVALGEGWRMPTAEEVDELFKNSDRFYGGYHSIGGLLVYSPITGNTLFFPMEPLGKNLRSGSFWTANVGSPFFNAISEKIYNDGNKGYISTLERWEGAYIRPVSE